jgi:hypothetical protein
MMSVGGTELSVRECSMNDEKTDLGCERIYTMDDYNYFSLDMAMIEKDPKMKT